MALETQNAENFVFIIYRQFCHKTQFQRHILHLKDTIKQGYTATVDLKENNFVGYTLD